MRPITVVILAVALAVCIVWDVIVAFFNKEPNRRDTITGVLFGWTFDKHVWLLPYAWGAFGGHVFLPREPLLPGMVGFAVLCWSGLAVWTSSRVYARFMVGPGERYARFPWHALLLMIAGTAAGHLLSPAGWTW